MLNPTHAFLEALFAPYPQEERALRFEIRCLCPKWRTAADLTESVADGTRPRTGPRDWYILTPNAVSAASSRALALSQCWDVYVGVLPRLGRTGGQRDVPLAAWLWADVDGGEEGPDGAVRLVKAFVQAKSGLSSPHLAIVSGGGLHVYWRLAEAVCVAEEEERRRFKALLKRMCQAIGGASPGAHADASRADTASILRIPGTYNHKREGDPKAVRILHMALEDERRPLAWWRAQLPPEPAPRTYPREIPRIVRPGEVMALPPRTLEKIVQAAPEGIRHRTRLEIAVSAAKCGWDEAGIENLLDMQADACGSPGSVKDQNRAQARWAYSNTR